MGQISFFTPEQASLFDQIISNTYIQKTFYFTGGTALSYFYLKHRYSDDFDFFSEKELDIKYLLSLVEEITRKHNWSFSSQFKDVVLACQVQFSPDQSMKIDFGHYPYRQVEKSHSYEKIQIDSLLDIAINKITAIQQRTQVKDYVDLYFLLKQYPIWDLFEGVKVKFNMKIEPFLFAADLSNASSFTFLPHMIKPLELDQLKGFYRELAKKLGKQSVE